MIWTTLPRSSVGDLSAHVAGDGPLVVLVHGVGLRAEAWTQQLDALAQEYRCIALDMPGHGESAIASDAMTVGDYTDAIAQVIDRPALVAGHSMGAMIALDLADRYPEKLRGVAALNAVFERSAEAAKAVGARAESLDGKTTADPTATLTRWFGAAPSPERAACKDWLTSVDPAAYKMAYTAFATSDVPSRESLRKLTCPALFMTGAKEPNSTPAMSQAMAARAPKGQAIVVEGAAHMMPMTHAEAVNQALLAFAQEVLT